MMETLLKIFNPQYLIIGGAVLGIFGSYLANEKAGIESKATNDKVNYIKEVSVDTNNQITGGDSYCSMLVTFNSKTSQPRFDLNHVGDMKIEKVRIIIVDSEKLNSIGDLASTDLAAFTREYKKCSSIQDFDVLYPNTIRPNIPIVLDETLNDIELAFEIHFANRILNQTIRVDNYKTSNRVIKSKLEENGKIIVESEISAGV
jgi:hypothetical protein